jgi:hypothetical protein
MLAELGKRAGRVSVSACSRPLRIHSSGAVFLKCAPSNPTGDTHCGYWRAGCWRRRNRWRNGCVD